MGTKRGLGLYAVEDILAGKTIMTCAAKDLSSVPDAIPFSVAQFLFVNPMSFHSEHSQRSYLMVCGDMVFLNHSDSEVCSVSWDKNCHGIIFASLIAKDNIASGEELTIRYVDASDYRTNGYF